MVRHARSAAQIVVAIAAFLIALAPAIDGPTVAGALADVTPPQVESDAASSYVASATITIVATDAESGVDYVSYNLDGAG